MEIDLVSVAAAVVTIGGALGATFAGARWARARWRRVSDFLDDWNGEPARPGVSARLGMVERVSLLETNVRVIRAEVTPDHGGSMKDAVNRVDERTQQTSRYIREHLNWHTNRGEVDPTAGVILSRPDGRN